MSAQRRPTVTETRPATDAVSVTPRCERCGARLLHTFSNPYGGRLTTSYRPGARYCSGACRQAAYRQRKAQP